MDGGDAPQGDQQELRALYERSVELEKRGVSLSKLHNLQQLRRNRGQVNRAAQARRIVLVLAVGIVAFYIKSIYFSIQIYPNLRRWWGSATRDRLRYAVPGTNVYNLARGEGGLLTRGASAKVLAGTSPEARKGVSAYQIATTVDYPAVASLLNLLLVWTDVKPVAAAFLLEVVNHFEEPGGSTVGVLNLLHFQGALSDYMARDSPFKKAHQLLGEASGGPLTAASAWDTWRRSGSYGNIWVELFPGDAGSFAQVPVVKQLLGSVPGSATEAELDFERLMDGGLVAVAATAADRGTGIALFNRFFGAAARRVRGDCGALRADGAMNGAMALGMVGPGMGIATSTLGGGIVSLLMAAGGAAAGAIIGGNAAGESCKR